MTISKDLEIKRLKSLINKDELTGLLNRRGIKEEAGKFFQDIKFTKENKVARKHFFIDELSVIFIDIDNFKQINDKYGHRTGDQILQHISSILKNKLRSIDLAGRWGGEELLAVLIGAPETDAYKKANEIRKAIQSRVKIPRDPNLKITVSIGVVGIKDSETINDIISRADKAMYEAKHHRGKNTVVKYSEL